MSCLGVKRSAAHFELESPVKRVRQYLKEGYMTYGSAWAEQQFATGFWPAPAFAEHPVILSWAGPVNASTGLSVAHLYFSGAQ